MGFRIERYSGTDKEDREIIALLNNVFVQEGYTEKEVADRIFTPPELQKRGNIKLARSPAGRLLGMAIFVLPSSPRCQVANTDDSKYIYSDPNQILPILLAKNLKYRNNPVPDQVFTLLIAFLRNYGGHSIKQQQVTVLEYDKIITNLIFALLIAGSVDLI